MADTATVTVRFDPEQMEEIRQLIAEAKADCLAAIGRNEVIEGGNSHSWTVTRPVIPPPSHAPQSGTITRGG